MVRPKTRSAAVLVVHGAQDDDAPGGLPRRARPGSPLLLPKPAVGEFGRSPRIFSDGRPGGPGRTHWPQAFSAVLAGGGLRSGQVIGSSTRDGGEVKDRPISPQDLWATVYTALGIDLKTMLHDRSDRPVPILPDAEPIWDLL